jgi:hypothetical protein
VLRALFLFWGLLLSTRANSHAQELSAARAAARTARIAHTLNGHAHANGLAGSTASAAALDYSRRQHLAMLFPPNATNLGAAWTAVGPAEVSSQSFGNVTGRVTALAIDPNDATGNTLYVGTTGGGVWKSTNAAGAATSVSFVPLTDTLSVFNAGAGSSTTPSLSIGALAMNSAGVLLAGTGDPNDATDSYYGSGILRSADGGNTWTIAQGSKDGVAGNHTFFGMSVAGLAFSAANPSLAVAALSTSAEGIATNAPDSTYSLPGLYLSTDAGVTWQLATILDGNQTVQGPGFAAAGVAPAATAVAWNPLRQMFFAAIRAHGYYQSPDGVTWTRMTHQPGAGLTTAVCPANPASTACPIFRGALAVQPGSGDMFALTVDSGNLDQGLYRDTCASTGTQCASSTVLFATALDAAPLEVGGGSKQILQADYNLALAAVPAGTDTLLYAGTIDLYRCSLAAGCTLRNTTNAENGCLNPAQVFPAQHAIALLANGATPLLYLGNDGGLYRSTDGVKEQAAPCSTDDASHFQNLNGGLGSLAEIVSFAQDPVQTGTLIAGLGALGTAGTGTASGAWPQLATGEGGSVAIDQMTPKNWFLSTAAGINLAACTKGSGCGAADFAASVTAAQVAGDPALVHAPWLLDPAAPTNVLLGTCRAWRGPAASAAGWSSANNLSRPFGAPAATACGSTFPLVRSLAAAGPAATTSSAATTGSQVLYAGLEGAFANGVSLGGHVFVTANANLAANTTVWRDAGLGPVTNDPLDANLFNPGHFDLSSIAADPHDATGSTVYAAVLGFAANGVNSPHVYSSTDAGAHWTNISANLPNAPANAVLVDPNDANTVYVALDTGVYATTQVTSCATANCWSVYGIGLPNAPAVSLNAAAAMPTGDGRLGVLRVGTYGRGIWSIPLLNATTPVAPAITINPAALTFAASPVGSASAAQTLVVTNTGNAALTISSVVTSGDFTETDTCARTTIVQGATCSVQVSFLPTATGARAGLLTVYGNVPGGQATAALSGTGTAPATIVLTPTTLAFATTVVGATSPVENITVSNTGGTASPIQAPVISGDFKISASTCMAGTLAAGTGCTVSIVFAPTVVGSRAGTLSVTDGTGTQLATQVATLSGTATAPATDTLSVSSLAFAPQQVGSVSAAQTVTLTNAGDSALTLINAQITSGDFAVANGCGNSLAGRSSCAFSVTYIPHAAGAETGVLTVSDAFRSQTVQLTGTGLAPAGVSLLPSGGLAFGAIALGQTATPQAITLTNNGGVALVISSISANGDFFVVTGSSTCGAALAPSAQCTASIGFTPTVSGARSGSVTVQDSAANSPQTLPLTGSGIDFTLSPDGATTATIASGATASYLLLLDSTAGTQGNAQFTCSGVPANAICSVNPASPALGATTVITVSITTGQATGDLRLPAMPSPRGPAPAILWAGLSIGGLLLALGGRKRLRLPRTLVLAALVAITGCSVTRTVPATGSGGTPIVTPTGTYNLVVAASSAGLVRSVNLTLMVQ